MVLAVADRVREQTTTTGTGTLNLDGAVTGFQGFVDGIGDTNTCHYCITDGVAWEIGIGTITDAAPDTLSRDTVIDSSTGGTKIDWAAGTKNVYVVLPGDQTRAQQALGVEVNVDVAAFSHVGSGGASHADVVAAGADGFMTGGDKTKIDGIENGATADQTDAEIKTAYENNANTNEFDDTEQSKLAGIESGATADQTGAEIKTAYEAEPSAFTDALFDKLNDMGVQWKVPCRLATQSNDSLSGLAARDGVTPIASDRVLVKAQTAAEDNGIYAAAAGVWSRTADADDNTNITSGMMVAVEEGTADVDTLWMMTQDAALTIGTTALPFAKVSFSAADQTKLDGIESGATADQTDAEVKTAYENNANTNEFDDAEQSKLGGIETLADVTDAANINAAGAVMETDFNANTVLAANSDNVPLPLTVALSRILGRKSTGNISAMTAAETRTIINVANGAEVNPALISQSEAEAGTATTERIFSALRVAQAIAALGGGSFTAGDRIFFQQTTPSTGWTKETNAIYDDAGIRLQTGAVTTGGTDAWSVTHNSSKQTDSHSLSAAQTGVHNHTERGGGTGNDSVCVLIRVCDSTSSSNASTSSSTANAGSGSGHTHTMQTDLKFAECSIGIRN